jgi:hypothetical protein
VERLSVGRLVLTGDDNASDSTLALLETFFKSSLRAKSLLSPFDFFISPLRMLRSVARMIQSGIRVELGLAPTLDLNNRGQALEIRSLDIF